jgi:hypothetical protein
MRLNERKDVAGDNLLHSEEYQSGRHQKGRKQGYQGDQNIKLTDPIATKTNWGWVVSSKEYPAGIEAYGKNAEEAIKYAQGNLTGKEVADAPFRKDWGLQLFKRQLQMAIEQGKDGVSWTDGATQAARYRLSTQIDALRYSKQEDGTYKIKYIGKGDGSAWRTLGASIPEADLAANVGKEVAEKIVNGEGEKDTFSGAKDLRGTKLEIGGEGMKKFYDQMLPKEIGKYVEKKFKGKVEQSEIVTGERYADPLHDIPQEAQDRIFNQVEKQLEREGIFEDDENVDQDEYRDLFMERQRDLSEEWARVHSKGTKTYKIWKVKITPEMREAIQTGGQPQFTPEAATPQPSATSATQTLENVRLLTNSFNAGDGGILKNIKLIVPDNKKKLPLQELMMK